MASQLSTNTTRSGKSAQQVECLSSVAYIRLSAITSLHHQHATEMHSRALHCNEVTKVMQDVE